MKKVKFRINATFKSYKIGDTVTLDCDDDGLPLNQFWYRRYLDSEHDNCISPLVENYKTKNEDK